MESLVDKFELGVLVEAEGKKFDIKATIDGMIEKLKKLWETFVGTIKQAIETAKKKTREFMEKYNITSVGVRALMKDFDYSQLDILNERLKKVNNGKGFEFISPKYKASSEYVEQDYDLRRLFENDFDNIEQRIRKLDTFDIGDAKREYETIRENIADLQKKAVKVKDPSSTRDQIFKANYKLRRDKERYGGYLPKVTYTFLENDFIDNYFEITDSVSKSDVERIIRLAEDNVKQINKFKDNTKNNWSENYCKSEVDRCKKSLEKAKKAKNGYHQYIQSPDREYDNKTGTYYVPDGEKYEYRSVNNNIYLLMAKLELQLAQVRMKMSTFAYKKQLEYMNKSAMLAVLALSGLKVAIKFINSDKFDPETGDYNGKLIKIKNS